MKKIYKLLNIQKELIIIKLSSESIMFRITSVKLYHSLAIDKTQTDDISLQNDSSISIIESAIILLVDSIINHKIALFNEFDLSFNESDFLSIERRFKHDSVN